jgi:chromate reductase, NAD(P)H dehydrogenase (quinone)
MITIISGTNKPNSNTFKVASKYAQLLQNQDVEYKLLSLELLPENIAFGELFGRRSAAFQEILNLYITPSDKFLIVSPEYNGSFPGILKLFLDAIHPDVNRGKKVLLAGVSSGRAGNLRGMEHLTGVLNYLGIHVHPNKLPISSIGTLLNDQYELSHAPTIEAMQKQLNDLLYW